MPAFGGRGGRGKAGSDMAGSFPAASIPQQVPVLVPRGALGRGCLEEEELCNYLCPRGGGRAKSSEPRARRRGGHGRALFSLDDSLYPGFLKVWEGLLTGAVIIQQDGCLMKGVPPCGAEGSWVV